MKKTTILSGKHTEAGNFTGYNALGERIHVSKAIMESLGMPDTAKTKLPLFAIIGEREFEAQDENNQPTGVMFKRTQALSAFKTAQELIDAVNSDKLLDINTQVDFQVKATSAGLTEKAIEALLTASI